MDYYSLVGPFIRKLPAEAAHGAALRALTLSLVPRPRIVTSARLQTRCMGLEFPNPVGLAAGFDKNAEVANLLLGYGFGFVEAGTVTPLPQPGNPRPRMFRLPQDQAVVNALGFNNEGVHRFVSNLKKRSGGGIIGANIGRNKDSMDALYDYTTAFEAVYGVADYVTVNISSPNTIGLRDLQQKSALSTLIGTISRKRDELAARLGTRKPVLYKIAPDLSAEELEQIAQVSLALHVDGLIMTNTTIARPDTLRSAEASRKGGLSGKPLMERSTQVLRDMYRLSHGKIPLIGVGGIASAEDAYTKIRAGASLVQLYTALVYQGMELVAQINEGLAAMLERDGFPSVADAVGADNR